MYLCSAIAVGSKMVYSTAVACRVVGDSSLFESRSFLRWRCAPTPLGPTPNDNSQRLEQECPVNRSTEQARLRLRVDRQSLNSSDVLALSVDTNMNLASLGSDRFCGDARSISHDLGT